MKSLSGITHNIPSQSIHYEEPDIILAHGDSFRLLENIIPGSINMIFADPPYFLSGGGTTNSGGKRVSVNKGNWDTKLSVLKKLEFNRQWISKCYQALNDNGTIWVSGTLHNIYSVGVALEEENFKILNNITWQKTNPPPNLACRTFTHSTETILWAKKNLPKTRHYFNYELMKEINNNRQMKDVWEGSLTKPREKSYGKHPTQKPEYLLERIILSCTRPGDLILDPYLGSGTTGKVAKELGRKFIGIELEPEYLCIAQKRIAEVSQTLF